MKNVLGATVIGAIVALSSVSAVAETSKRSVINTYADIAQAMYEDSLAAAKKLQKAVDSFVADPNAKRMKAAQRAWLAARNPYQSSEVYRFGNAIVDDWEGKVNAWPLDEGLIDYVDRSYGKESDENPLYTANVIANTKISYGGKTVDTSKITKELLSDTLHEIA